MKERLKKKGWLIAAGMLGAALFCIIYGVQVLNPCYDAWMYNSGDLSQHYLGWRGFRASQWFFPLGLFDTLSYPARASVIFVDAIPALALVFKTMSSVLPETFQYFGWWGFFCFVMQGILSTAILRKILGNDVLAAVGSIFFILSPVMLRRLYGHEALAGHWLLMLAFLMVFYWDSEYVKKYESTLWMCIGMLTASTHMYFVPMCGIILVGYLLRVDNMTYRRSARLIVVYMVSAALMIAVLGGFSSSGSTFDSDGVRRYTFNLNGFWNTMSEPSQWIFGKKLSVFDGQAEGFAYLGCGILGLLVLHALLLAGRVVLKKIDFKELWKNSGHAFRAYGWVVIVSFLLALSPTVTLEDRILAAFWIPDSVEKIWSVFRSTGRFIWPCYYLLMFWAISFCCKIRWRWCCYVVFGAALALQVVDMKPMLSDKNIPGILTHKPTLDGTVWGKLPENGIKHIFITELLNPEGEEYYDFAEYVTTYDMTVNRYAFAHPDNMDLEIRQLEEDVAYILPGDIPIANVTGELYYYGANGYTIGVYWPLPNEPFAQ